MLPPEAEKRLSAGRQHQQQTAARGIMCCSVTNSAPSLLVNRGRRLLECQEEESKFDIRKHEYVESENDIAAVSAAYEPL